MKSKLIALLMAIMLVGCASNKPKPDEITIPPTYSQDIPIPKVEPTDLQDVKWKLMNRAELTKLLAASNDDFMLYTLDDENASALLGNVQELKRYILSEQEVIKYLLSVIDARQKPKTP